jgi:pimeloyl-ACP methyl ester carboxylesterase
MTIPTIEDITAKTVSTSRLSTRVLFSGSDNGEAVLFVHGNASNATFWEEVMVALPEGYRGIAPDQRGYGAADLDKKIDATRGVGDLSDDLAVLLDHLGIEKAHVVGHSLGGSVLWRFIADYAERVLTATMVSPGSPYGFGGTKDVEGTLTFADGAGSGAGVVSPDFAKRMSENDTSDGEGSPRFIMNSFYWKPPFKPAREEELLLSLLSEHVGEQEYPGDSVPSENWPMSAPGKFGPANALSPIYVGDSVERLLALPQKPPILWVWGADDQIVSDASLFDVGTLGKLGAIPGYPGEDVFPPQPMVSQTRAVLEKYKAKGGNGQEVKVEDCGHTAYIEKPEVFNSHFHKHIGMV